MRKGAREDTRARICVGEDTSRGYASKDMRSRGYVARIREQGYAFAKIRREDTRASHEAGQISDPR